MFSIIAGLYIKAYEKSYLGVVRLCFLYVSITLAFFFFWRRAAWEIFVPPPRMEPVRPVVEAQSPNHWTAREFPTLAFGLKFPV